MAHSQWINIPLGETANFRNVVFINDQIGFCSASKTYKTVDGGNHWSQISDIWIDHLDFFDSNIGFASGIISQEAILRTTDGGITWESWESMIPPSGPPINPFFNAVVAISENRALFAGHGGWVYDITFETNGTITTTPLNQATNSALIDMVQTNSTTLHIINFRGKIMKSVDSGNTWTTTRPGSSSDDAWDMHFIDENIGYVIINDGNGHVLKTIDGGNSYNEIFIYTNVSFLSIDFYDENHGFVVGNNGIILFTNDGGMNWNSQNSGTSTTDLNSINMVSPTNAVIVGDNGTVLRNFGELSINEHQSIPSLKLFPNPSNDFIEISGISESEEFKIYDIVGYEIMSGKIHNNERINIKNLNDGLYFLSINNRKTVKFLKK
ncbi:YCF48-related protein [Constantimarinum furrinae]|uniref:Photosynthesis system II assembly factor Ycf48/Hcf136-like domain-containing protein n=1 Tax=Constantimarinum furrinae TaxID=2562285 RepID=A0A7G8PUX9_9FLAO|nr:YCF48-related protein [Constantimarinum furrinae]QNJ98145.1 hypothetical protein ALE3EI_1588 [Constantimarinum furrinae]